MFVLRLHKTIICERHKSVWKNPYEFLFLFNACIVVSHQLKQYHPHYHITTTQNCVVAAVYRLLYTI